MKPTIPVFSADRQIKSLRREIDSVIRNVLDTGSFILGPVVEQFEREFAAYLGVSFAVGVASGTDALSLALLATGVGPGDEVLLPANSYPTVFAVTAIGAVPRLVDIDPVSFTMDPDNIIKHINSNTKAIIPVHLYGNLCHIERIIEVVKRYSPKVAVIEDCAQAAGAEVRCQGSGVRGQLYNTWRKVGSIGDAGCFSFYPTKNLGAFGDGGMVVTNNPEIAERLRRLRMYGEDRRYNSIEPGRNSRLDELQAAVLRVKLKYLDKWNQRRRSIASKYESGIWNLDSGKKTLKIPNSKFQIPCETEYARHVYHLYVIRSKQRDELKAYLEKKGIGTGIHYPAPIHLVPSMKYLGYKKSDYPEAERASREILSLPMFPELKGEEVESITTAIREFGEQG